MTKPKTAPAPEWLRKADAAKRLDLSERSLQIMASDKKPDGSPKLKSRTVKDPVTKKVRAEYHAGDIERIAWERSPEGREALRQELALLPSTEVVVPPPAKASQQLELATVVANTITQGLAQAWTALQQPPPRHNHLLTKAEAADYLAITEAQICYLVRSKRLVPVRFPIRRAKGDPRSPVGSGWLFSMAQLDAVGRDSGETQQPGLQSMSAKG